MIPGGGQAPSPRGFDWGVAGAPLRGEVESGDRHLIAEVPRGVLVAVVDALGHGSEAAAAADLAIAILARSAGAPVEDLVARCHERLAGTRGVAMGLAFLPRRATAFSWLGVGDVEGVLVPAGGPPRHLLLGAGVVGYRLPPLRVVPVEARPGDTLLLATDGIDPRFAARGVGGATARAVAEAILARYRKETDDALIVAVRWEGGAEWRGE